MADRDPEHTCDSTTSDSPFSRPPACFRLSDGEQRVLEKTFSDVKDFTAIDRDHELCSMLNSLYKLEHEIQSTAVSGTVRLETWDSTDRSASSPTLKREVSFSIQSEGLCQKANWPLKGSDKNSSWGRDILALQGDTIYHKGGDLVIKIAIDRGKNSSPYHWNGLSKPHSGRYDGPIATIRELTDIMVRENNSGLHLWALSLPRRKILVFLRTLCGLVARVFRESDPKHAAEFQWAAAATAGALPPVDPSTTLDLGKAMTAIWNASRLSEACCECQRRVSSAKSVRLMDVATKQITSEDNRDYAAISYCWSSVKDDDDLLAKVKVAVQDTPIEFVWIDRFCLSSEPAAREDEVHRMSEIYANARLVIILPGAEIPELDNLCYDANGTALQVNAENCRRIGEQWTQAEWRNRCWTYQEASMARATAVVTGSHKKPVLSGAALDALATCRGGSVKLTPWHPLDNTWLRADLHMYQWDYEAKQHLFARSHRVCGACGLPRGSAPEKQQMLQLMSLSWNRRASKELDTVYSLLSMAEGGENIPVDYEITMQELYSVLIKTKVVGAELLALGGGFVGPGTCWMPDKDNKFSEMEMALTHDEALQKVDAEITTTGTLRAAVVPVSLSGSGRILHLKGFEKPLYLRSSVKFDSWPSPNHLRPSVWSRLTPIYDPLDAYDPRFTYDPRDSFEVEAVDGCQIHALAPPTTYTLRLWAVVLIFSSGEGTVRHVEKTQVVAVTSTKKRLMESLAIEIVEFGSRTPGNCA